MPELVTLNSAPYNPYNDTFARFAMEGLQMGIQQMQHKDALIQHQADQQQSFISDNTKNLYRGVELQMQSKDMENRQQNELFNQHLRTQEFSFNKDSFWARLGLDQKRQDLEGDKFTYQKEHDTNIDDPFKVAQTRSLENSATFNEATLADREKAVHQGVLKEDLSLEDEQYKNKMDSLTADFYKDNPDYFAQKKQAELDYQKSQTNYANQRAAAAGNMDKKQLEDWNKLNIRRDKIFTDLQKARSEDEINSMPRALSPENSAKPQKKAEYDKAVEDYKAKKIEIDTHIKSLGETLKDIESWMPYVKPRFGSTPTSDDSTDFSPPASTKSAVPYPKGMTPEEWHRQSTANYNDEAGGSHGAVSSPALDAVGGQDSSTPPYKASSNPYRGR